MEIYLQKRPRRSRNQLERKIVMGYAFVIMMGVVSILLTACEKKSEPDAATNTPVTASQEPTHAPKGAQPGSHEDWCGGHQVPESLCTRCNPSLTPAFKATNDWCKEHGLPESQCLICNPNLKIERPPKNSEGNQ